MRTVKVVVAVVLAMAGLTGCGRFGSDPGQARDERLQQILDEDASFTVFLRDDATEAQRTEIEAALRTLPGSTGVTFTDHETAYRQFKQWSSAAPDLADSIEPEALPESFLVDMTDIAAVQKIREDDSMVKSLPGVQEVVFPCTTVPECKATYSTRPTASPS